MTGGPDRKDRHGIGANRGPMLVADTDPGPADDFCDTGPLAWSSQVAPADRERFYVAIRSQGPEQVGDANDDSKRVQHVRRRAIDMAKERARRDRRLSGMAFRVFDLVASRSKWRHRYYWQSMEMLAFASSQNPKHSNVARYVDDAVELGYLVEIYVPSLAGGRHKRYLTVPCTPADRTGQTLKDIRSEAIQHKVRGAEENQGEITADESTSNPQLGDVTGTAIRDSDALPCNSGKATRNPDVSTRSPDVSMRSPDALTLDKHLIIAKGGEEGARPAFANGVHRLPGSEQEVTPHSPPPAECDLQHKSDEVCATETEGVRKEIYAIHRSWWPALETGEADGMLDRHLEALTGNNPAARLEHIILSLKDEHTSGDIKRPGKVVKHRVEQANSRARAGKSTTRDGAAEATAFKSWGVLANVGFGGKVTGADAMDILAAVPGSDPGSVRRLIREVCGKWAGTSGKAKSAQHVVDEVIRRLRSPEVTSQPVQPAETVRVGKPTKSAQDDAATLAALRKQMAAARSPTGA
jgi:hypothetical protein